MLLQTKNLHTLHSLVKKSLHYLRFYIVLCILLQNASAQAALQAAQALSGQGETQGGPNTVLRVIIEHMIYPITLEVLYTVSTLAGQTYCSFRIYLLNKFSRGS